MELPLDLRNAIDCELTNILPGRLSKLVVDLSDRYRKDVPATGKSFIKSQEDVDAYVAFRMPATFAANYFVFSQVKERLQGFNPKALIDIGAGPGTVMWSMTEVFPEIDSITLLEREEGMINLGKRLAAHTDITSIKDAVWVKVIIKRNLF